MALLLCGVTHINCQINFCYANAKRKAKQLRSGLGQVSQVAKFVLCAFGKKLNFRSSLLYPSNVTRARRNACMENDSLSSIHVDVMMISDVLDVAIPSG